MLTPDEQAELDSIRAEFPEHFGGAPQDSGIMGRIGQQAANFIPNVGQGLANSAIGLVNLGQPSGNQIPSAQFPRPYDIPPAQGFGQQAVDVGAGIGQVVAEAAIPGGIVTKAGRLAGLGRYAPIAGDIAAGLFHGLQDSPSEGAQQGVEFGSLGAANLIPNRAAKLLANAAIPVAGQLLRGQNPLDQQSLINTGANIAVPAILGQYGRRMEGRELLRRQEPPQPPPETQGPLFQPSPPPSAPAPIMRPSAPEAGGLPRLRSGENQGDLMATQTEDFALVGEKGPDYVRQAREKADAERASAEAKAIQDAQQSKLELFPPDHDALLRQEYAGRQQDFQDFIGSQGHELLEAVKNLGGLPSLAKDSSLAGETRRLWATNKGRVLRLVNGSQTLSLDGLRQSLEQFGFRYENPADMLDAIESRLTTGKPQYGFEPNAEAAASILGPRQQPSPSERGFLIRPVAQYLAGASGGALAGPLVDQDPDKPVWEKMLEGAGVGLGAVAAARGGAHMLLRRAPEPVPTSVEDVARMGSDRFKGTTIRLVKNESELPPDWQAKIQPSLDFGNRHEGLVNAATGEVYLFKDNLTDPTRAAQVLAHEVAGHYGVKQILSKDDWQGVQDSVFQGDNPRTKAIAQAYFGTDDLSSLNPAQRETVTKEYLARLAENTPLNPNLWEKLKTGVNRATRAMGSTRDWSDSEMQGLIQRGAKQAEGPVGTRQGKPLLASNVDYDSLSKQRNAELARTPEVAPTDNERLDIRKAYEQAVVKHGYAAVPIADVLEKAGFGPADMERGRGIIMHMYGTGDITALPPGDWSISPPRERAWSVTTGNRKSEAYNRDYGTMMRMPHGEGIVRQSYGEGPEASVDPLLRKQQWESADMSDIKADARRRGIEAVAADAGFTGTQIKDYMERTNVSGQNIGMGGPDFLLKRIEQRRADIPRVQRAYLELTGGKYGQEVRIKDLKAKVPDANDAMLALLHQGRAHARQIDDSLSIDAADRSSALKGLPGAPRMIFAMKEPGQLEASLLPTKQAGQEQDINPTFGGAVRRILDREFGAGRTGGTLRAEESGKGARQDYLAKAKPLLKTLGTADANERKAILTYQDSAHTQTDAGLLRQTVRPEIARAMADTEDQFGSVQSLLGHATDDPRKQQLLSDTYGTYRTQKYELFDDPQKWLRENAANPQRKEALVKQIVKDNEMPGMNEDEISSQLDQYLAEQLRGEPDFQAGAGSSKISQELWIHRKKLSDEFKDWIGEIKDPVRRVAATFQKLINSAAQAKKIVALSEMGQRGEMDIKTWKERMDEKTAAQAAGNAQRVAELDALKPIPKNPAFGTLSGKLVPQDVIDSLNAHNEMWSNGVMRSLSGLTSIIKQSLTVDNPGTHARQWIQTPILAAVARVAPWDFFPAVRAIRAKGAEWEELVRNHIVGADYSSSELARVGRELDLAYNPGKGGKAMQALRNTQGFLQKAYGLPDNLVRAAAYLKHKPRFFAEGNALGMKGAELERYAQTKAMDFTNRYTMNYGAVPNAVKMGRETPFVTPFLSYQAEMLRILKNLGEDAVKGSPGDRTWAIGNLMSLVALPLIAMQAAKSQLSDKDREDWDRTNRLSPAYSGSQLRIPLGRNKDGSFRYMNVSNMMPAGDNAAMLRNIASGDAEKFFASSPFIGWDKSPVLNLAVEQVKGRDTITDQKLTTAGRFKEVAKAILPPLTPGIGYEADRAVSSFTQNAEGGRGLMNARTGRTDTPSTFLLRNVAGIPVSNVQPRALLQRAKSDLEEKKRGITSERNQITGTNAAPAVREAATQKALLRRKQAVEEYRQLLR